MNESEKNAQESQQRPVDQPTDSPKEGEHLESPEAGYPTKETQPHGGLPDEPHQHPEDIDDTTPDKQSSP